MASGHFARATIPSGIDRNLSGIEANCDAVRGQAIAGAACLGNLAVLGTMPGRKRLIPSNKSAYVQLGPAVARWFFCCSSCFISIPWAVAGLAP